MRCTWCGTSWDTISFHEGAGYSGNPFRKLHYWTNEIKIQMYGCKMVSDGYGVRIAKRRHFLPGLPDVCFSNQNLGKFWRVLQSKMLVNCVAIWSMSRPFGRYILCPFSIFYAHLVYFMAIWYILCSFDKFMSLWYNLCSFDKFMALWHILCSFDIFYSFGML
jgi:hypothetical protein